IRCGRIPGCCVDRRSDSARSNTVDTDTVGRHLLCDAFHHQHHPTLRGGIIHMAGLWDDLMDRTDTDDLPRGTGHLWHHPAPLKFAYGLTGTEELSGHVDADHSVPLLEGHLVKGRIALQSGVVDQNVDSAKLIEHALKHRLDLVFLGDVGFV